MAVNTMAAITKPSVEWCIRDMAMICAVKTSDCKLNRAMQVEVRLAAAISSTVMNKNTPDDARALAAAVSNKPIIHLETRRSPRHLISAVKTTARIASADATPRKSGTRYIRNFATLDSTNASTSTSAAIFRSRTSDAIRIASTERLLAAPQGTNRAINNAMITVSLIALAKGKVGSLGRRCKSGFTTGRESECTRSKAQDTVIIIPQCHSTIQMVDLYRNRLKSIEPVRSRYHVYSPSNGSQPPQRPGAACPGVACRSTPRPRGPQPQRLSPSPLAATAGVSRSCLRRLARCWSAELSPLNNRGAPSGATLQSLRAQRDRRVHAHRPPRRKITRHQRHDREQRRAREESDGVGHTHAIQ